MKKIILLFFIAFAAADKLDRTYLPPPGSKFAGGSPGAIDVPLEFPKHTYSTKRIQEPISDGSTDSPETYNIGTVINEEQRQSSEAPIVISPASDITGIRQRNPQRLNVPTTTTSFATTAPSGYERNVYPSATYSPQRLNKNQDYRQQKYNPNIIKQNLPNSNQSSSYESIQTPTTASQKSDSESPFNSQLDNQSRKNQGFNYRQPGLVSSSLNNVEQKSKNILSPSEDQDQLAYPQNQYSMTQVVPSAYSNHSETNYNPQTHQFPIEKFSNDLNNDLPGDQNKEPFMPSSEIMTSASPSPKNFKEPTASLNYQNNMISKSTGLGSTPSPNYESLPLSMFSHPERPQAVSDRNAFILNYDNVISPEGFAFSFDTSNGIHVDESGSTKDGVKAIGSYSYTGDDGKVYTVSYTADENGFQPRGDHLPTAPPIPEEILKVIEQNKKDEEAGIYDDGTYDETKYGYKNYEGAMDRYYPQVPDNSFGNVEDILSKNQNQLGLNRKKPINYSLTKSIPVSKISDIGNNDDYDLIESIEDYKTQGDITTPSQISSQKIPDEVLQQNNGEVIRKLSNSGTDGFIRDSPVQSKGINNLASVKNDLNEESENKNKLSKESDSLENLKQMYKPGKKTDIVNHNLGTDLENTRRKIPVSQIDFENQFLKNRQLKPDTSRFQQQETDITTDKPVRNNFQQKTYSQAITPGYLRQGYESTKATTTQTPSTDSGSSKLYIPPVNQFTPFGTQRKPITVNSQGSYSTRRPIQINIDNKGAKLDIPYSSNSNIRRPIYSATLKPTTYFDNTLAINGGTVPATELNTAVTSNYREEEIAKPVFNSSKEYENTLQLSPGNQIFNTLHNYTFLPSTTLTPSTFELNQTPLYSNNQQYPNKLPLPKVYSKPIIRPTSSYLDRTMAPEIDSTSSTEVSETPVIFGATVSTSDVISTSTHRPSYQFQDQTVQGRPVTYDEYGKSTVEPNQSSQLPENLDTTYPGYNVYSTPEEDTSSDVFENTDSYFKGQDGTSTTPSFTGTKSTVKITGEEFSGPKQPQKYDAGTGYYYK